MSQKAKSERAIDREDSRIIEESNRVIRTARENYLAKREKQLTRQRRLRFALGLIVTLVVCAGCIVAPAWVVVHFIRKEW